MRNLLEKSSAAQCLDEEPSNGETAYPRAADVSGLSFRTQVAECDDEFVQAARLGYSSVQKEKCDGSAAKEPQFNRRRGPLAGCDSVWLTRS